MLRELASGAVMVGVVVLGAASAHADDEATLPLRIDYAAPLSCPSEELFVAQLRERVPTIRVALEGEAASAVKVDVVLADSDDPYQAKLVLVDREGARSERVVTGSSCADVVRALAFITSVYAVERAPRPDPQAQLRVTPPPPPAAPPSSPSPPSLASNRDRVPVLVPRRAADALLASVGARNGIGTGLGPEIAIAYERFEEGTSLAPALRLRVAFAPSAMSSALTNDRLVARLFTAAVDGCALRIGTADHTLGIAPCLRFEGGVATGEIERTVGGAPWFAPGALAHLRWVLADHLLVEADAGVVLPLVRTRWYAYSPPQSNDATLLARAPALAPTFSISAGWAFR
jgi:hypothetical protein